MARKKTDLFARLSLDYADHPKIQALSDAAFRAHVEMILYARRYLTDGRIPNRVANRFGFEVLAELSSNDPERPSLAPDGAGDYWLHGYADMQETKEEVTARRLVNSANGSRGGRPVKRTETQPVTEPLTERGSQKKAETETETETETLLRRESAPEPKPVDNSGEVISPTAGAATPKRKKRATAMTDDWQPEATPGNLKAQAEHDTETLERELLKFRNWHISKDETRTEWNRSWQNWLMNAHGHVPRKQQATMGSVDWRTA